MLISSMPTAERLAWTPAACEDYLYWQGQDRRPMKRFNQLIQACLRDAFVGIGKPKPHL
ncbi:MAG: toxin of the YoeB-YefM toxin-antitoxin system [Cyanobacteriota bacterium]|jgi:toxin YoeB